MHCDGARARAADRALWPRVDGGEAAGALAFGRVELARSRRRWRREGGGGAAGSRCGVALRLPGRKQARLIDIVNRLVRKGTERVPLGGVPFGGALLGRDDITRGQELVEKELVGDEDGPPRAGEESLKTVLILMSDTGGGHRASAEAIKATFELEFGDQYKAGGHS